MHAHRPLLTAAVLLAGVALAQTSGTSSTPSYPTTNPTPNDTGSISQPPPASGTDRHPAENRATGSPMTPPASSALGTTPSPSEMLADLHMANQSEVDLGKVAEQRARSKDVKAFGKHMVKDHTALDKDLQSWAKKNNVTVGAPPQDDEHQAEMQKMQDLKQRLQTLSGTEFDKTYMQAMAEDHANDLKTVRTFRQQTTDKSLLKLLEKAEKVIASHKKDADKLVQKLGATASR
jgi:putative membrane protein